MASKEAAMAKVMAATSKTTRMTQIARREALEADVARLRESQ